MNEEVKKSKINRFLKDEAMVDAVYGDIRDSFLEGKGQRDIQILAAERIAVDLLDIAWRRLDRHKDKDADLSPQLKQVGL